MLTFADADATDVDQSEISARKCTKLYKHREKKHKKNYY